MFMGKNRITLFIQEVCLLGQMPDAEHDLQEFVDLVTHA